MTTAAAKEAVNDIAYISHLERDRFGLPAKALKEMMDVLQHYTNKVVAENDAASEMLEVLKKVDVWMEFALIALGEDSGGGQAMQASVQEAIAKATN